MSTIFILGTCLAAVKAAEKLKQIRPEDNMVLYSLDGSSPIDRDGIIDVFAKKKTLKEIDYPLGDLQIQTEQKISKVNLVRKRLYLETREQIPYDTIIITETGAWKFPEIKGTRKIGCLGLKSRRDIEQALDQIVLSDDIVLQAENLEGLLYALALTQWDRTITLLYSGRQLVPGGVDPEIEEAFLNYCQTLGLTIYPQVSIAEVLGDADVKAVRLSSGKVIAAQCVLFTDISPDMRVFSELPELRHGLLDINDAYLTTVADTYALGDVINMKYHTTAELEAQAQSFIEHFTQQPPTERKAAKELVIQADGIHVAQFGQLQSAEGVSERSFFQKEPFIYKKFLLNEGRLCGALLINAQEDESLIQALYRDQTPVEGRLEPLLKAVCGVSSEV